MLFLIVLALLGVGATGLAVEDLDENQVGDDALIFGADPAVIRDKAQQAFENSPKPPFLVVKLTEGGTEIYAPPTDEELVAAGYPRSKPQVPALSAAPNPNPSDSAALNTASARGQVGNESEIPRDPVALFVQQVSIGVFGASPAAFSPAAQPVSLEATAVASAATALPPSQPASSEGVPAEKVKTDEQQQQHQTPNHEIADADTNAQGQRQHNDRPLVALDERGDSLLEASASLSLAAAAAATVGVGVGAETTTNGEKKREGSEAGAAAVAEDWLAAEAVAEAANASALIADLAATATIDTISAESNHDGGGEKQNGLLAPSTLSQSGQFPGNGQKTEAMPAAVTPASGEAAAAVTVAPPAPPVAGVNGDGNGGVRGAILDSFRGVLCLSDSSAGGGGGGGGEFGGYIQGGAASASPGGGGGVLVVKGGAAAAAGGQEGSGGGGDDFAAENKAAVLAFRQAQKDAAVKAAGDQLCLLCFDERHDAVFLGCGHGGACYQCAVDTFVRNRGLCPFCRAPVDQIVTIVQDETGVHPTNGSKVVKVSGPNRSIFALLGVRHGDFGISI